MNGHLNENPQILNQITKSLKDLATKISQQEKEDSKWTPAVARAYGMRIDQKIKSLGRNGLAKLSTEDKLDSIIRMLMGVSSGNLMTLAVSRKGGMLAKAALAKGLVTEDQANDCYDYGQVLLSFSHPSQRCINHPIEPKWEKHDRGNHHQHPTRLLRCLQHQPLHREPIKRVELVGEVRQKSTPRKPLSTKGVR